MDRALDDDGPRLRLDVDPSTTYVSLKTGIASCELVVEKGEAIGIRPELREDNIGIDVEDYCHGTLLKVGGVDQHRYFNGELAILETHPCLDGCPACRRHAGGCGRLVIARRRRDNGRAWT